jgi:hypothetical protein
MIAGAIALYEEALHEQAPVLVMRTADGRGLPLQIVRWCGRPDAADEELLERCRGPVLDRANRARRVRPRRGHLARRR